MRYVAIPHTTMRVSHICLGTGDMGTALSRHDSFAVLDAFVEAGGTFLDTAHVYGDWCPGEKHRSETTIGQRLKTTGQRDRMILATKGAHPDLATMHIPRLSPREIIADLDESLDCLGVGTIDLYWLHRDDPQRSVDEIVEMLNDQVRVGKIRFFGCSNWTPARIGEAQAYAAAHGLGSFVASQLQWSLAVPNPGSVAVDVAVMDDDAHAFYHEADMAVLAFSSQAKGFFTKARSGGLPAVKESVRRDYENEQTMARLARAGELAVRLGTSITAIILAYITSQPFVAAPIVGCQSIEQLRDSLADADVILSPDMLHYLVAGEGD